MGHSHVFKSSWGKPLESRADCESAWLSQGQRWRGAGETRIHWACPTISQRSRAAYVPVRGSVRSFRAQLFSRFRAQLFSRFKDSRRNTHRTTAIAEKSAANGAR